MVSLVVFALVVIACVGAPIYAHDIAHVDPFQSNVNGTTIVNGKTVPILQSGGGALGIGTTPIGPTWDFHHYFLGADGQGRDVMARLLYGGRNSLHDRDRARRSSAASSPRSWPSRRASSAASPTACSRA